MSRSHIGGVRNKHPGECKVFFFGTQGFGWHTIGRPDEDRLIISMLLCPYLAASNLCVLMHLGGLERGSVDAFVTLMEAATTIRSELNSAHQTQDSMDIVDVLAGVSQYETGRNDKDWPLLFREQSILPATCRESRLVISLQYLIVLLYSLELILTCIRLS